MTYNNAHIEMARAEAKQMDEVELFRAVQLWLNRYEEVSNEWTMGMTMAYTTEQTLRTQAKYASEPTKKTKRAK